MKNCFIAEDGQWHSPGTSYFSTNKRPFSQHGNKDEKLVTSTEHFNNLWIRGSVSSMGIQAICKEDDFEGGKMKEALLAPQTAMRHHSQRGPEAQGQTEGASRFRGTQRECGLNFLSRRRRSGDRSPLLILRQSVVLFLASYKLLNLLLFCFSLAISQSAQQLTTREKRSVSLLPVRRPTAIRGSVVFPVQRVLAMLMTARGKLFERLFKWPHLATMN